MNDTERLDAIDEYGLFITSHDKLYNGQWERTWICHYGDRAVLAPSFRDAIDLAVTDLKTDGQVPN